MIHIKRLDEMASQTQLGVRSYMYANRADLNMFNANYIPFYYRGYWFYPVAAKNSSKHFDYVDSYIDYGTKYSNFSKMIGYNYDDFYNEAKKYGYGKCDVFASRRDKEILYLIPTGSMLAGFPLMTFSKKGTGWGEEWRKDMERKLNDIFDKCDNGDFD